MVGAGRDELGRGQLRRQVDHGAKDGIVGGGQSAVVDGRRRGGGGRGGRRRRRGADGRLTDLVVGDDQQRWVEVRRWPATRACRSARSAFPLLSTHKQVATVMLTPARIASA